MLKQTLNGTIETLHFDEAWLPHAAFHEFYKDMHAIGKDRPRSKDGLIFATHSTHKLLAGISQASQIIVQESETRKLDRHIFNEAYLMHTSTSPQYAIIASCDVSAAMMEPPGGTALVEESIIEALDFRRAMRKVDDEWGKDWWFKVWGPERLAPEGMGKRDDWLLRANEKWHGFGDLAPGFTILDPIKATIITPGLDVSGKFAKTGIPASIVTRFLAEHGVIVEKTGLYSFFIMFTIGITKGRWNTLVTALQQFKDDYDKNQPLWKILPEFVAKQPQYERVGLRDLCQQIHDMYKANDVARVTTEMYLSDMQPAMKPSDAFACMAHRDIERVEIDELEGRVTSVLLTPYPPGIPLLIPGERFNRTIVEYLKFARTFNAQFPGLRHRHPRARRGARRRARPLFHGLRAASADATCRRRSRLQRLFPFLGWPRRRRHRCAHDLSPGITVSLVAIPQSLAYAQLAGVPPQYGLYAAFVPSIVGVLFGSSPILSTGPVAMTSLLTAASVGVLVPQGTDAVLRVRDAARAAVGAVPARLRSRARGRPAEPRLASGADGIHQRRGADHRALAAAGADGHLGAAVGITCSPIRWNVLSRPDLLHEMSLAFGVAALLVLVGCSAGSRRGFRAC